MMKKNKIFIEYMDEKKDDFFKPEVCEDFFEKIVLGCADEEKIDIPFLVNIYICDDEYIKKINLEYRNIDKATDVLSFPMTDSHNGDLVYDDNDKEDGFLILGDIMISKDHAYAQAEEYGHGIAREAGFLLSHGMFHLMGYDHIDGDDTMFVKQENVLISLGLTRN